MRSISILSKSLAIVAIFGLAGVASAQQAQRGMMKSDSGSPQGIINDASTAYRALLKSSAAGVPSTVLTKAQCVVVVPDAVTAAALVGGTHGDGIASCKSTSRKWSTPAFVDLNEGSIGAQLGAKSSDIILYFTSPEAVAKLKQGKFEFGADASVVAGNFERSFDTGQAGVVAYQRAAGAFLGASLSSGRITADDGTNRSYYGKQVDNTELLEARDLDVKADTDGFTALLP